MSDPFNAPPAGGSQPGYVLPPPNSGGPGIKMAILFGAVIALIAANVYLYLQIDSLKHEMAKSREAILEEVVRVKEGSNVSAAAAKEKMDSLKDELETARRQAAMAVGQAKVDAEKHAEEVAKRLEQQQRASEQKMTSEISKVEQTASTKIGEVSSEVAATKADVSATKAELDKTIASLKSTQGDLGVQSGLIATNGKELAALKALGERNYFDIKLGKTKTPVKIGDIFIQLKKTDPKKNKYTINVTADDKTVEKKDKGVNEPVQFLTSRARQPYEIVINEVGKDQIVGYLATPKVQTGR